MKEICVKCGEEVDVKETENTGDGSAICFDCIAKMVREQS